MWAPRFAPWLSPRPPPSTRLAAHLHRLPRGARAGVLAVSIAAGFAVAGSGAQASPPKDPAPTGPATILVGPEQSYSDPVFEFKSATPERFLCSLDDADYELCESPASLHVNPGWHTFRVRTLDGPAAEASWFTGPIPTPTPRPTA